MDDLYGNSARAFADKHPSLSPSKDLCKIRTPLTLARPWMSAIGP